MAAEEGKAGAVHSVEIVPMLSDNYSYLLCCPQSGEAAAVDPVEPKKAIARAETLGFRITTVLTTHSHWDHAGGNEEIAKLIPGLQIIGGAGDNIPAATREVREGDVIKVGSLSVQTLETRKWSTWASLPATRIKFEFAANLYCFQLRTM